MNALAFRGAKVGVFLLILTINIYEQMRIEGMQVFALEKSLFEIS
jgi:hypothetical protein